MHPVPHAMPMHPVPVVPMPMPIPMQPVAPMYQQPQIPQLPQLPQQPQQPQQPQPHHNNHSNHHVPYTFPFHMMPVPDIDMTPSPQGWRLMESTSIHIHNHIQKFMI